MFNNKLLIIFFGMIFFILGGCSPSSSTSSAQKSSVMLYGTIKGGVEFSPAKRMENLAPAPQVNYENYENITDNPVKSVEKEPISTFSIDVDTASYSNHRRYINSESLPPVDSVRIEEFINYFGYNYPEPINNKPFSISAETFNSPWKKDAVLLKIGIKAKNKDVKHMPPANLVFLVDVSGSMYSKDKLPLAKKTLEILTEQLRPEDKVTLITYSGSTKVVLSPTSGKEKEKIFKAIEELQARGSTAGESAIQLAYKAAEDAYIKNGINRILLLTDGDFNVGVSNIETLRGMISEKRKSGISLSTFGFGTGNYNDYLMEKLADDGDGNYSYIDNETEAKRVLDQQLSSTLETIAQDVKIQVEFNPNTVSEYRLIGYETRALKNEDFNNDEVDAGDIGAGHNVTALYEIIPTGKQGWNDKLRYQKNKTLINSGDEYAYIKIRYKLPNTKNSILISQVVNAVTKSLSQASKDAQFAVAVAGYAQILRGAQYTGAFKLTDVIQLAQQNLDHDKYGFRKEFVELVKKAQQLQTKEN